MTLAELNALDAAGFLAAAGPWFEKSPWIAERAQTLRPFANRVSMHAALTHVVQQASEQEWLDLISAHPDLVGRAAREGTLTRESTAEQRAAGLGELTPEEASAFDRYNAAYRERFGFTFVICARENRKQAILAAFPVRLQNSREQEIATALAEIGKIAWLRLCDSVKED